MLSSAGIACLFQHVRRKHSHRGDGEYATAALKAGETVRYIAVDNCTHFFVLEDLARPSGIQMRALASDMAR